MSTPLTQHGLRLEVPFQGHPEMKVPVIAYAFNPHMKLLAAGPVVDGVAELPLTEQQARTARIMIAPPVNTGDTPTYQKVRRMNPYKVAWRYEEGQTEYKLLPVPELFGRAWMPLATRVRGRVVKAVEFHGMTIDVGVENARVNVFEVDRRFILRDVIDLEDIIRISDLIKERYEELLEWPTPPGPPPVELELRTALKRMADLNEAGIKAMPLPDARTLVERLLVSGQRHMGLLTILRPWIVYTLEEQGRIGTGIDGNFDTTFTYWPYMLNPDSAADPLPDLYFTVECRIDGEWTVVYARPVSQDTYWEYNGRFVLLRITDARVEACPPPEFLEGHDVGVLTIGNWVSVAEIQAGLTAGGAPFGGTLEPHVFFGEELARAGAHYRWSYRKVGTAEPWRPITAPVVRHYAEPLANGHRVIKSFVLGPVHLPVAGPVFRVQPLTPPTGQWVPEVDARTNTASAFWGTLLLDGGDVQRAHGLYELKLELFDAKGHPLGGNFLVPQLGTPVTSATLIPAPTPQIDLDAASRQVAFRLQVVVDNRPCTAQIPEVRVAGHPMDGCGFITVPPAEGAEAEIAFQADQPGGFATFAFNLYKGRNVIDRVTGKVRETAVTQHNHPSTTLPEHVYMRNAAGIHSTRIPVADLTAPCVRAAFGEYLYVYATATDGWNRLSQYDRAAGPLSFAIDQTP